MIWDHAARVRFSAPRPVLNMSNKVIIKGCKGIDLSEIEEKKHNFFIGISISNKFFTPENIKFLILFALENTKEKVLIWIPGRMQATNYRYFDMMSRADALQKAFLDEDKFKDIVNNILNNLDDSLRSKIVIANYDDVFTSNFIKQRELFFRVFSKKGLFYENVLDVAKEIIESRGRTYSVDRAESIALYIISELPLFVNGVSKIGDETIYTVVPYPGFGKIDDLVIDIVEGKKFPELTSKLNLKNKVGILDIEIHYEK